MPLVSKLRASIAWVLTSTPEFSNEIGRNEFTGYGDFELAAGAGDNQADRIFRDRRTIAASGTDDLDLSGSLVDPLGAACVFAKVKAILVRASKNNTNNVVIGGDAAAFVGPFGNANDVVSLPPGGMFMVAAPKAGWAVTPTTADILQIANSAGGTSVEYDIVIVGTAT